MNEDKEFEIPKIKIPKIDFNKINFGKLKFPILGILVVVLGYLCYYTVDANENAVVLRFGKYSTTTEPGLHFKIPFVDTIHKVKVDYQYKEEFGFKTQKAGVKTSYSQRGYEHESWMLTGDLKIAEVHWVVQYKINDPIKYLFKVRDVEETIRDVSEATMRLMIGDRSFKEVLQKERIKIANLSKEHMQMILDDYSAGIQIQMVQLQGVVPPGPVADSFNEVNRAKQEEETLINEANQEYNKKIYRAQGLAEKLINEARGYAAERVNHAEGESELFNAILKEYREAPDITKKRLYIEKMESILSDVPNKMLIDSNLDGILPFLNLKEANK